MKYKICLISMIMMLSYLPLQAKGGIPIFYSDGDDVVKVLDLPKSDEFMIQAQNGQWYHANLGIMHQQFSVFGIPLVNYGTEEYVLYTDQKIDGYDFTYADLTNDDIEYLQSYFGGIPDKPELPFWDAWGGKLLVLVLIGGFIIFKVMIN